MADKTDTKPRIQFEPGFVFDEDAPFDDENPEWTEEMFAQARPAREVLPPEVMEAFAQARAKRRGRPPVGETPKLAVKIRLDAEVVEAYRATGRNWQTRLNADLRQVILARP
jgi:uncharacterized protein (DUF4415 family)